MSDRRLLQGGLRALAPALLLSSLACALPRPTPDWAPLPAIDSLAPAPLLPPPDSTRVHAPFPAIQQRQLDNGLGLQVVERRRWPLIELRLVVRSGSADDGSMPGLAGLTGQALVAGGAGDFDAWQLVERAERLGTDLAISTGLDATYIAMNVMSSDFERALELLAAVATAPRFDASRFGALRAREVERRKSAARGDAAWVAAMALYSELYATAGADHPYAHRDAWPEQLARIELQDCSRWYQSYFVPSNATLIVAGDIGMDALFAASEQRFSAWSGGAAPEPSYPAPLPSSEARVYVVDRPASEQAQILVGLLGPARHDPGYPGLSVADQILGGGVSGRLFLDLREQRGLAYATGSRIVEVASAPMPLVLSAGTRTQGATQAVAAMLANLSQISAAAPRPEELERAKALKTDGFVLQLETLGSIADLAAELQVLRLPRDYHDQYRARVRELTAEDVARAARVHYAGVPTIVVAGDARLLADELRPYGRVVVRAPGAARTSPGRAPAPR